MMNAILLEAPAKINLHLSVLRKFADGPYAGYHDLDMLMQTISLADRIEIKKQAAPSGVTVSYPHQVGQVPLDEHNLTMKAWRLLQREYGIKDEIAIHIEKNIPVGAGLAGGSSDAAAVLKGVNQLFGLNITKEALAQMGAFLGGDVPFCVYGGLARAEGMGEKITPLAPLPQRNCLLVNPGIEVLTSEIFQIYDTIKLSRDSLLKPSDTYKGVSSSLSWKQVDDSIRNDLEEAAVYGYPVVAEVLADLRGLGLAPFMSGSGPSVIAFLDGDDGAIMDEITAEITAEIKEKIASKWQIVRFCHTL